MSGSDLWQLSLGADRQVRELVRTRFSEGNADISPDGRWLAYQSNQTGRFEIYVTSYPTPGETVQISSAGGVEPVWGRDSRELFYRSNDRYVAVSLTAEAKAGEPRLLFSGNYLSSMLYVPGPDRFLFIREDAQTAAGKSLNLVLGWFNELTAKATPR